MQGLWKFIFASTVLLAVASAAGGLVLAQSGDEGETPPATAEEPAGPEALDGERPNFVARLAEQLGISEQELRDAVMATEFQIVDEWLEEDRITGEQAERLRERIEAKDGQIWPVRPHIGKRPHKAFAFGEELANFLGITVEELREARMDEQSLAQTAEANGVSRDELIAFLVGQVEEKLAEKLEEGKIDQGRADEMLAQFEERVDDLVDRNEPFRPHRPFRKSGQFFAPDDAATTSSLVF